MTHTACALLLFAFIILSVTNMIEVRRATKLRKRIRALEEVLKKLGVEEIV